MADRLQFQKKLSGLVRLCNEKGRMIEIDEVEAYFGEDGLTDEQMELVYDFLLSQNIIVKGYVKKGGTVKPASDDAHNQGILSSEEEKYLKTYEAEMGTMPEDNPLSYYLPKVVEIARELHRPEVFLGDLIQEGNVGLMLAMEKEDTAEEEILAMVRQSMEALLEEQAEVKVRDRKMVERVQELDELIKKLTEEMGRKVSVDELAQFSELGEEEIADILKLAGEEVPEDEGTESV